MADSKVKITVLSENTGCDDCPGEHGLSLFIESGNSKILLDAGQSSLFYENAVRLGINLAEVDIAVLSHSHYDHADGFEQFFKINSKARLYVREESGERYYALHEDGMKYIGPKKGMFDRYRDRIVFVKDACYSINNDNIFLVSHNSENLSEIGEKNNLFKMENNHEMVPDDFAHEQSMVVDSPNGLLIFNSCSHAGPDNILREVTETLHNHKVYAYIGGFHLFKSADDVIMDFTDRLNGLNIDTIITGHCTGDRAYDILNGALGDKIVKMKVGMSVNI